MMKSIFDQNTRHEIISRIDQLTPASKAKWGKMTVEQMVKHCTVCEEYYFGNVKVERSVLGRIFGKIAIKEILKDENSSFKKNAPTASQFKVTEIIQNLEAEKEKWKTLIKGYDNYNKDYFVHWFFGKMTKEQLGQFMYKHSDHHLKQFNV